MLLAIDIGNSSINMGLFSGDVLVGNFKIPTDPAKNCSFLRSKIKDFLADNCPEAQLDGIIISSVVPALTGVLMDAVKGISRHEAVLLTSSMNTGLAFDVMNPADIGSDRLASVVAAKEAFGQPALVVDFGTATTLSAVMEDTFIGGAILPGLKLMGEALGGGTSKLPYADMSSVHERALAPIGKNTMHCIFSGIIYGSAGAVERLIAEMEREGGIVFNVVLTGGNSDIMTHFLKKGFHVEPALTLHGLRIIYERNV